MMDRAERRVREMRDDAGKQASELLAEVSRSRGREPELESRIADLEHELVRDRADSERLRMQLSDANTMIDQIESTTTVDITSLQAQLKHEQQQNAELRAASREVDFVRREFEHKLAQAQEQAMHARADAGAVRAALDAMREKMAGQLPTDTGRVVYERPGEISDYEFAVASYSDDEYEERLSEAI
jgi:chromosome segregation ATPase